MNLQKKFLIMDSRNCIDCDNCVLACKRRHGVERFARYGFQVGYIRIPTTCKDCEAPDCVEACKFSCMIKTNDHMTQALEDCNGCRLCARKCPFGAIEMLAGPVLSQKMKKRPPLLLKVFQRKQEHNVVSISSKKRKKDVWKCDGCANFKHRGCVYNCPTGALREVVLADFIKTIPHEWAEALINYLAPAFLNAEEKSLVREGRAKLIIDENKNVRLELIGEKMIQAA